MKDKIEYTIIKIAAIIAFLLLLGWAGHYDYQDEVIQSIPCVAYEEITNKVGSDADDIIREYREHQSYYDSLE